MLKQHEPILTNMKYLLFSLVFLYSGNIFSQDFALKQLENSPRHQEWIKVKSGTRNIHCFVAYPEKAKNRLAVIIIHENRGLTDWVRSFADQIAAEGYIAIAPDLLSDFSADMSRTSSFSSSDDARNALYQLNPDQITSDLNAVQQYAANMPSSNGKTVVAGFCWGGSQTFRFATNNGEIEAALVFYGSAPAESSDLAKIEAPVFGFYGENDQRINAGIPDTEKWMKKAGKKYDYVIYPGAGHAYMRQGDDPDGSAENRAARNRSWLRIKEILSGI